MPSGPASRPSDAVTRQSDAADVAQSARPHHRGRLRLRMIGSVPRSRQVSLLSFPTLPGDPARCARDPRNCWHVVLAAAKLHSCPTAPFYTDRIGQVTPRISEEISPPAWRGGVVLIQQRMDDGSLAHAFPDYRCPDDHGRNTITGTDATNFLQRAGSQRSPTDQAAGRTGGSLGRSVLPNSAGPRHHAAHDHRAERHRFRRAKDRTAEFHYSPQLKRHYYYYYFDEDERTIVSDGQLTAGRNSTVRSFPSCAVVTIQVRQGLGASMGRRAARCGVR
jgi:hypothetical protein